MHRLFYSRLAWNNLKNNSRTYLPYILTCICSIAMFYIMVALAFNPASGQGTTAAVLYLGVWVIAIFSVLFLFYTNSFLMKRRKKEFGLYNILGMEKKHIAKIITLETLYTYVISIILGLAAGMLLSKLVELVLLKILDFDFRYGFEISGIGIGIGSVLILFTIIFAILLIISLVQIKLANPIQLLKAGQTGEKEPRTKWILAILGVIFLAGGYYISIATEDPVAVIMLFFVAVVMVILGTYLLFLAGSIAILKLLRQNKNYYYKPKHFISVSSMMYRMKQNAAGLATICILSTMVLVMISSTAALFFGIEDAVQSRYPKEITINNFEYSQQSRALIEDSVDKVLSQNSLTAKDTVAYRTLPLATIRSGSEFSIEEFRGSSTDYYNVCIIPIEDFSAFSGINASLAEDEALLFSNREVYGEETLTLLGHTFSVDETFDGFSGFSLNGAYNTDISPTYYLIVKDIGVINALAAANTEIFADEPPQLRFQMGFDLPDNLDKEENISVYLQLVEQIYGSEEFSGYIESRSDNRGGFFEIYGGLFFLGIFLGLIFIMATVLIIYYKQISEGYDDQRRFGIMQKVGLSRKEAKKAIRSQILTMFFLPLVAACIHLSVAFPALTKMLQMLNLTNVNLFVITTLISIGIFALFYTVVYVLTAKTYYKIVNSGN